MDRVRQSFIPKQVRARPLAAFAACFLVGLLLSHRFALPLTACLAASGICLVIVLILAWRRKRLAAAMMLLALCLGAARMSDFIAAVPGIQTRYSVEMTGRIVSEPFTNPRTGRVIAPFQLETADGLPSALRLRLYLRGDEDALSAIDYGQRLRFTGHIWACDPVTNPYEFDFGEYLRRDGLCGYATAKIEEVTILETRHDIRSAINAARRAMAARIDALFPQSAPLVRALILGDRSLLGEEMREALSATGTAHLISISGLHVSVLAFALAFLLKKRLPDVWANGVTLVLLGVYGALIGLRPPFVRALVMFAIFSFAPQAGYPSDAVTRLGAAALMLLLLHPMDALDAGFILSFVASAGILLLTHPLERLLGLSRWLSEKPSANRATRLWQRTRRYFLTLLSASIAAQLASLPCVIALFGVQSVVSIPFNLVCVPLCMAGYPLALAALALSLPCFPLAALLARVPDALLSALLVITQYSANLPVTALRIGRYPMALILLHVAVILAASELSRIPEAWRRFLPLTLILVAGLSSLNTLARAWPFGVTFLDAGQADCAVVRTRGHTYLMDAGDIYSPAADYLGATCLRLDGVFLSHPHADHCGGLTEVLTTFRPGAIYIPAGWHDQVEIAPTVQEAMALAGELNIPIVELAVGDSVALSADATLSVWSPDRENPPSEANDLSMLALIECQGERVLFTGDLSQSGEPEVIPDTDVLKVAHHGSAKATSPRFQDACTPEIAIISVGENRFGHPSEDTVDQLLDSGAGVWLTRDCGAITLTLRGGRWQIETYLEASHALE